MGGEDDMLGGEAGVAAGQARDDIGRGEASAFGDDGGAKTLVEREARHRARGVGGGGDLGETVAGAGEEALGGGRD